MTTSVIVAGARTPVGKLMGSLKDFSGSDLGAIAIAGALEKAGVPASAVEYVIMGQVLTAGAGQMPARQAAVAAGIGWDVPALTINKMCLSGIDAIALADQLIRAGEFDVVVAGGQESMTQAPASADEQPVGLQVRRRHRARPHGLRRSARCVHRPADGRADRAAQRPGQVHPRSSRTSSPRSSHQKAAAAWKDGVYADEVVPVKIPQRKGDPLEFTEDEGIRANTTADSLAGLKPAFRKDGTITAGSASQISDGAAAVVVMNKAKAEELGLSWLCEIGAHGVVAGPDSTLQIQPANAIKKADRPRGHHRRPARRHRDQRGVRGGRAGLDEGTRRRPRQGQRQRRRDRHRASDRHVGCAHHPCTWPLSWRDAAPATRVAALCGAGGQGDALILRAG